MKIAVYVIGLNEEQFIARCVQSAQDADVFVLCDTGSTDQTIEIARAAGAIVHSIHVRPWRFDFARNIALGLVPADVDVCVSIDADEILEPGWRDEIERVWELGKTTRLRYVYDWGQNTRFAADKIHARNGYLWRHPCHERLAPDGRCVEIFASTDKLLVTHLPDPTKSRGQYLELLKLGVQEDPYCPRNSFYLGREYTFYAQWTNAETELKRYLAMPTATWGAERAFAMRLIGQAREKVGDVAGGLAWYRKGVAEAPERREPWVALAEACYRRALWPECLSAAMTAISITAFQTAWPVDADAWGYKPYDLAAIAAYRMGLTAFAVEYGRKALELAPEDERLKRNMAYYVDATAPASAPGREGSE